MIRPTQASRDEAHKQEKSVLSVAKETQGRIALFENSSPMQISDLIRQFGFVVMLGNDEIVVAE